ncbi:hypothetical protein [Amycolatopsis palatopharyngis]|uniref:hypothetical protein n=1 Tax=Amycolatopsis palatopharyngis TaxID=187982 RepID=UPI000E227BDA|nr:hypothetical protein [Amycolatopsis palatopharyngis]
MTITAATARKNSRIMALGCRTWPARTHGSPPSDPVADTSGSGCVANDPLSLVAVRVLAAEND